MKRKRGFTLIELLVALTLFAVAGGALLQLFQSGLRTARLAAAHTHAVYLARSKINELQAYTHLRAGTYNGSFGGGYRWQAVLSHEQTDDRDIRRNTLRPLELNLTIRWGAQGEDRVLYLQSLLLTRQAPS